MGQPPLEIRVVAAGEAALLENVVDDVFDHPVQPDLLRVFLASPDNVLVVARVEGQVVGMASGLAYVHPDKPLSLFINEVGVSARFQGRGIGRLLLDRILIWGRDRGCAEAWVATEIGNEAARRLYESAGGVEDDERAAVYVYSLADPTRKGGP
jgi:ribosomal protein S18 acetylase RimI-like enzyme